MLLSLIAPAPMLRLRRMRGRFRDFGLAAMGATWINAHPEDAAQLMEISREFARIEGHGCPEDSYLLGTVKDGPRMINAILDDDCWSRIQAEARGREWEASLERQDAARVRAADAAALAAPTVTLTEEPGGPTLPGGPGGPTSTVYRLYGADGELLYVGRTGKGHRRIETHMRERRWWPEVARATYQHVPPERVAEAEAAAIRDENPKYNLWRPGGQAGRRP